VNDSRETTRRIFGERAAFYTTSPCHSDPKVLARVIEHASPRPGWCALDVATGTGHTAFALASHVAFLVGIDLTPQMLAEAEREKRKRSIPNVAFTCADARDLPFPDAAFQLVTCRRAPHHFPDIDRSIEEMKRVLPGGGRLLIDDRSVPEDDFVDRCMNRLDRLHDASHVRQYRPREWREMLEGHGFVVDAVEPYTVHRPLASLTDGVSPEDREKICEIITALDDAQKRALNVVSLDGILHINHWYVMVSARKD
jgi:ubiquinone/menaquinone biosynthesis C-methylase UbiE